jgi:hypothetical protein
MLQFFVSLLKNNKKNGRMKDELEGSSHDGYFRAFIRVFFQRRQSKKRLKLQDIFRIYNNLTLLVMYRREERLIT